MQNFMLLSKIPTNSEKPFPDHPAKKGLNRFGNKAGYTATQVACGWAGAIFEATPSFGQEQ